MKKSKTQATKVIIKAFPSPSGTGSHIKSDLTVALKVHHNMQLENPHCREFNDFWSQ